MARTIEITVPRDRTNGLVSELSRADGLVTIRVHHDVAVSPPGDVVVVQTTTDGLHAVLQALDRQGVGRSPGHSITTFQPDSLIASGHADALAAEGSDASWEEMEHTMVAESTMNASAIAMMALAGVIATVGLATNALHLVIAAMIIAPAFEPISRVALSLVAGGRGWRAGARDIATGYVAIAAAGAATALLLRATGNPVLSPTEAYFATDRSLVAYWSTFAIPSLLASAAAATVGALLIVSHRSVLTAGVLIALALIPTSVLVGIGVASGAPALAGAALGRLAVDVALVFSGSLLVFALHRRFVQRRRSMD